MATYATYRHIELDKVGYSKKRVRNPPSDIFNVLSHPAPSTKFSPQSLTPSPRKSSNHDSFHRLFGETSHVKFTPRRLSLTKGKETSPRNPVTGDGVQSWDVKVKNSARVHQERNPVTGETYTIVSPATTPTKVMTNGFHQQNGHSHQNGHSQQNGHAYQNGHSNHNGGSEKSDS